MVLREERSAILNTKDADKKIYSESRRMRRKRRSKPGRYWSQVQ